MGSLRFLSFSVKAAALCIALILVGAVAAASAEEAGCPSSTMYVAAHEDDTLLFQSPNLLQDIQSERCVRTVFLTAGDAGRASAYWTMREAGAEDAYAQMAGVANQWSDAVTTVNGHSIHLKTLKARPGISIAYLKLPDGGTDGKGFPMYANQSLMKLWNSTHQNEAKSLPEITSIKANDNSATYGYEDLIQTLAAMMTSFGSQQIYTQNYTVPLLSADHPDHVATGLFTREASKLYVGAHRLVGYRDYETSSQAQNVFGTLLGAKSAAFYKYGTHDSDACGSEAGCTGTSYATWLLRQYTVSAKPETTGVVANAGFMQLSEPGATITLDGSQSSTQSGTLQYIWTQTLGPAVTLKNAGTAAPSFTAPSHPTKIVFSLVVKAGSTSSKADTVTIKLPSSDPTPTAIAAPTTQAVASGASVNLDGSESWDPNSATLQYAWLQTGGPAVTLTGSSTATPSFAAPTGPATIKFSLMVSNGNQTSAPSPVTIDVKGTVPTFTSATSASFTTGVTGSFKVETTASPTATLSRAEGELPPGMTFTANADGTATIAGTPAAAAAPAGGSQPYTVKVKATNSEGSNSQTLTLTATNPGTAPLFTSGASVGFSTGVAGSFTVSTSGEPTATVTRSTGTLPSGVSVTSNGDGTLTISGTPAASAAEPGQSQDYALTFKAKSAAGEASQPFTLTVTNPGTAPQFTSASATSFTVGASKTFTISASGAPAAAIANLSGALPPGLDFANQGNGTAKLSGSATAAAAPPGESREFTLVLQAKNGAGSDDQTLTVTVSNPGTPPSFTSAASTTFTTGVAKTFTVITTGAPTAAIGKASGALPAGLSLSDQGDGTAKLSGAPTDAAAPPGDSESYEVVLKAKSLAGEETQKLTITVSNPGTPPAFTSVAQTGFTTGTAGSFTVSTSGEPTATVTKSSGTLPSGVSATSNANGTLTISGTPAASAAPPGESQSYALTFKAKSAAGEASQPFTLTVSNPGTPPSFTSAAASTFTTGTVKAFTVSTTSNPTAALARSGALPPGIAFADNHDGTATISGTATGAGAPPAGSQDYPLNLEASALSGSKTQAFTLTVTNPGTPPAFTSATSTGFTTGVAGSFKVTSTGAPTATLSLTGGGELPAGVGFVENGDGSATISGTASASAAPPASSKNYPVTIQAQSGAGKATQSFTLTVTNPGSGPTITSDPSTGFTTGIAGSFKFTSTGIPAAMLTHTGELPAGVVFSDNGDGTATISGTPAASSAPASSSKNYPLTIKASNGVGNVTQPFTLTVTNPGVKPAITSADSAPFTTGAVASFTVTSTANPTATLSRIEGELPDGLSFSDEGDGTATIAGTPTAAAAPAGASQAYTFTIKASNGAGSTSQSFTLTVTNPGTGPSITSAASTSFTTAVAASFEITSAGAPTATLSLLDGDLPPGVTFDAGPGGTATIAGTPAAAAAPAGGHRDYPLTLRAASSVGTVTQTFTLTVVNPGVAPTISSPPIASFTTGVAGSFEVTADGDPRPALSRQMGSLPDGLVLTDNGDGTATISGTPAATDAEPGESRDFTLTLKATSAAGEASQTFTLRVTNPGVGPAFTSAASTSFTTGVAKSFTVATTGVPAPALTKSGELPAGLRFSDNGDGTATISGTAAGAAAAPGTSQGYPLSLSASSAAGSASQPFTLTVVNPETPVVTPPVEEKLPTVDPPKPPTPEPPPAEPVRVSLSRAKVVLPVGRFSRRVVQVTAPSEAAITCKGKLPKGVSCRVALRKVVIEGSKTVKKTGTFHLTVNVAAQSSNVRRALTVQMLAPDDPALRMGRLGAKKN